MFWHRIDTLISRHQKNIFPITRFELSNERTLPVCHAHFLFTGRLSPAAIAWKGFTSHLSFLWLSFVLSVPLAVFDSFSSLTWSEKTDSVRYPFASFLHYRCCLVSEAQQLPSFNHNHIFLLFRILIVPSAQKRGSWFPVFPSPVPSLGHLSRLALITLCRNLYPVAQAPGPDTHGHSEPFFVINPVVLPAHTEFLDI